MENFSKEQLKFLALLKIFEEPVHIDIIGYFVPLLPGPFMALLEKCKTHKLLQYLDNSYMVLNRPIPDSLEKRIDKVINKIFIDEIFKKLDEKNFYEKLDKKVLIKLYDLKGEIFKSSELSVKIAHEAVKNNELNQARDFLHNAVKKLYDFSESRESKLLFISSVLELSNLNFMLGTGFHDLDIYLNKAQNFSRDIEDTRSHTLINLHLGRLYYFTDRREDALVALSMGHHEVEEIGDDDILIQSAVFVGLLHLIKGSLREAIKYFELSENAIEQGKTSILKVPTAPLFLGYCAIYLGEFHKALGTLDYYWRKAKEELSPSVASLFKSGLGNVLVILKKFKEAEYCLKSAREEAIKYNNILAAYFAGGGLVHMNFLQGKLESSYEILKETIKFGTDAGLYRQFASPWILELFYEFEKQGFEQLPYFKFSELKDIIMNGVNIHLQGVCYRLMAQDIMIKNGDKNKIKNLLKKSEKLLTESGDRLELSKTIFELAKTELSENKHHKAISLIYKARKLLGGYIDEFFPVEFNSYIDKQIEKKEKGDAYLKNYFEIIKSLYPVETKEEICQKLLLITTDIFGAERSGLFLFKSDRQIKKPELKFSYNLSSKEVNSKKFKNNLLTIIKSFNTKKPIKISSNEKTNSIKSILCVPIELEGSMDAVLYYDNLYLDNAFDFLNLSIIEQISKHIGLIVKRRLNYLQIKEERDFLTMEKELSSDKSEDIIANSEIMLNLLKKIDKISKSDSSVLIIGETGTGKELVAKRIHEKSNRKKYPFIVVDCTTIPENLIESELFGHEKGSFTGADKRKVGRIELAHNGTLFIDEIGELSIIAQTKLLRVLQEKHFTRVGGTQIITSDFRLIAATNRDLKKEVREGKFREDLFFRLNVIPVYVPPLRERKGDIILIAKNFIEYYSMKYHKYRLRLTKAQEKQLLGYEWPGNIRELKNVIERAVLLSEDNVLNIEILSKASNKSENPFADLPTLKELEKRYIKYVLEKTGGKISGENGTAEILGLKRTTLYSKMKILGMSKA